MVNRHDGTRTPFKCLAVISEVDGKLKLVNHPTYVGIPSARR